MAYAAAFLLPWATTGHRVRSGYNLAGVLHQTRIVPNAFIGVVVLSVLAMPLLAAVTVAADLAGGTRTARWTLLVTSALVAVCVVAVGVTRAGPRVAALIVVVVLALSVSRVR